ncbi:MAG: glycine--tRNA ligase subunit beta [Armatimonadota bacterium]|nr:glycine--tRNA ligase subunit beta [Armatimonadota bacterium]
MPRRRVSGAPAALLVEIGTEELPPGSVAPVLEQLARETRAALREARIAAGAVQTTGTVRRLVLMAEGVASRQADRLTIVRGPAARIAYDAAGAPTQAAVGFARSQGVAVEALKVRDLEGGRYVTAEVREAGRPSYVVLAEILPRVIAGLSFPKSMRWASHGFRFGRPIRWVVALLGDRLIPLAVAGVRAGRRTRGHRFLAPGPVTVRGARAYPAAIRRAHVLLDPEQRRRRIADGAGALAGGVGGRPVLDEALLDELVWSTEHPTPLLGTFDPALSAALPREVVLVTLQHHQKCFGVESPAGDLLPAFIAVRDGGTAHLDSVRTGHEWVVRARLEDARFFLEEDRRSHFDAWIGELARLAHVEGLGSMADHVRRLERVAAWLAGVVGLDETGRQTVERAARLCKADLVTAMVREFPDLQGTMGRIYALERGEPADVASAVEQHYWPKAAGGTPPQTLAGALLAVADRAVLLAGALLAGLEPTGSQDPYGLRRAASGIAAVLLAHDLPVGLGDLFTTAVGTFEAPAETGGPMARACAEFVLQRFRGSLLDQGMAYDAVDAVFATRGDRVTDLAARVRALHRMRGDPVMARLATGFARASRILGQGAPAPAVDESKLTEPAEVALYQAWQHANAEIARALVPEAAGTREGAGERERRYMEALEILAQLADPIDRFFDEVLVMAPAPAVRGNRLALLREITATFLQIADFSRLVRLEAGGAPAPNSSGRTGASAPQEAGRPGYSVKE